MSKNINKNNKKKGGNPMSLDEIIQKTANSKSNEVKSMIISEYPLDSVVGSSKQCEEAKEGILKCVEYANPDVIFVDGLFSRIRYRETDADSIIDDDPLENFMEKRFEIGADFLSKLKASCKSAEIYYVFSDADEHNIRRLTHNAALKAIVSNKDALSELKKDRTDLKGKVKSLRKTGNDTEAQQLAKRVGGLTRRIQNFQEKALLRMPNAESAEWRQFKKETEENYMKKLEEMAPGIKVSPSNVKIQVKGHEFWYSHNWNPKSDAPLASRANKLIEHVRKDHMGNPEDLPDFFLESGHHGEAVCHPYRHGLNDKYSWVAAGMVMEDQKVVKEIRDKLFKPELFHGKTNKIEACKRQNASKIPPPGISILGKNKDGFYTFFYSMDVLSKMGTGKVDADNIEFQDLTILSDIHVGKGAVRYDCLENAINRLEKECLQRVDDGKSVPILLIPNESLQGYNYKGMPVETSQKTPKEIKKILMDAHKKGASPEELATLAGFITAKTNYPRIDDQVRMYFQLINDLVLNTMIYGDYEPSVVFNEGTHIAHTTGDVGISEVFLQTFPYAVLEASSPILKKLGLDDSRIKNLTKKYLKGGLLKFDLKIGDNNYKFSTVHKPGSASPATNIPLQHIKRAITMADDADIFVSAHLHTPWFYAIGKHNANNISVFYKGATFNEYDGYGKARGWSPAVIGYEKALVPKDKGKKGIYGVQFVLSDVLK